MSLYSTVTEERVAGPELDAAYWWRNVREPVQLARTLDWLIEAGARTFLQVGPHPVLAAALAECLAHREQTGQLLSSLRRGEPERAALLASLGALYVQGAQVDWQALYPHRVRPVPLPAYPWQREIHWFSARNGGSAPRGPEVHPLLGRRRPAPRPVWYSA